MIKCIKDNYGYESVDATDSIKWIGVNKFIESFKQPFNREDSARKKSKNKKSKWYGVPPDEIINIWDKEWERSVLTGDFYHKQRECDVSGLDTITRSGIALSIIRPIFLEGIKHAPEQKLNEGVYPEHLMYLKSCGICGQADRVEVVNGMVNVTDYKTNKEIQKESYKNWEGISKKMKHPISHLDDCKFNHTSLQLSMYLYMILKHNPLLKAGNLMLQHVIFEQEGEDKYGYPILKKNNDDEFIVKEVIPYEVKYMKSEIINMIKFHENQ